MRRVFVVALVGLSACRAGEEAASPEAPVAPVPSVQLFAEGSVSSPLPEFATTFSPSGDTVWFNRTPADRSRLDLFFAVRSGGVWGAGLPFEPTSGIAAIDPFMTSDGMRLYFSSNLPREGASEGEFDLWYLERMADGWSAPTVVPPPVVSDSSDVFNSVARDGTMVFSSRRDGRRRVWETRLVDGAWSEPIVLSFGSIEDASNPAISPDGRFLVFAADGPSGDEDLWVSCRMGSGWGEGTRLPEPVNSAFTDFAPAVTSDFLYFTSERPGVVGAQPEGVRPPGDVYRVARAAIGDHCGV